MNSTLKDIKDAILGAGLILSPFIFLGLAVHYPIILYLSFAIFFILFAWSVSKEGGTSKVKRIAWFFVGLSFILMMFSPVGSILVFIAVCIAEVSSITL